MPKRAERALGVDVVADDAVVAAIGCVTPPAIGVDFDVGGVPAVWVVRGQGRNVLEDGEGAALGVEAVGGECVGLLVDNVRDIAERAEAYVPGARLARRRSQHRWVVGRELAGAGVEAELAGLVVGADVRHKDKALVLGQQDGVCPGAGVDALDEVADGSVVV